MSSERAAASSRGGALGRALLYNAGRIASYSIAGALVGGLGLGFAALGGASTGPILRIALGVVIALTGLVLIGFTRATAPLVQAEDAERVDTSTMSIEDVVAHILASVRGDAA